MVEEVVPQVKHLWWQCFRFGLISYLLTGGFWVVTRLWMVIKWGFAPAAFLIDMLILMPLGKFIVKTPQEPNIEVIKEAELPDYVWLWMEQSKQQLLREGYVNGQLVKIDNLGVNQMLYLQSLVHPERQLGVGLGYIEMTKDASEERHSDMNFAEFTFVCKDGKTIDLSNLQQIDALRQLPNRSRYNFQQFGVYELSLIASQISEKSGCYTDKETQHRLTNDMPRLFMEEYELGFEFQQNRGYVKSGGESGYFKLTWKGALRSALMTLWPTSVYFKHAEEDEAEAFCASLEIDLKALYEDESCNGIVRYDQTISELNDLELQLDALARQVPQMTGSLPISISYDYEEDGRISRIDVNMELRKDYPVREYVSSSECLVSFDNDDLVCEYSCNTYDLFYTKEEHEKLDMPQLIPSLTNLLPLSRIISIAAESLDDKALALSNASLQMDEQSLVWTLTFCDVTTDSCVWLTLDPHTGKVIV